MSVIYKICPADLWQEAETEGTFAGAGIDFSDGFIHFSTYEQVADTTRRFFAGVDDLVLVAVDAEALGEALRYEPAGDGTLFPHLYGSLSLHVVRWARPILLAPDGTHELPDLES